MQSHGKIAAKFYTERADAKSANLLQKFMTKFRRQKPVPRPKPAKKEVKDQKSRRKFLPPKFLPQISRGKIALDMGRDLNSQQIFRAKFTQKSALNLQNLS